MSNFNTKNFFLFLGLIVLSGVAWAKEAPHSRVRAWVEPTSSTTTQGRDVWFHFEMDPGWHIYWVNPGDSGLPTAVDWKLPPTFRADPLIFPAPRRIGSSLVVSYGFEKEVWALGRIHGPSPLPQKLNARVHWMECADICQPRETFLTINTTIPPLPTTPVPDRAKAALPVRPVGWSVSAGSDGRDLVIQLVAPPGTHVDLSALSFFPLDTALDETSPVKRDQRGSTLRLRYRWSPEVASPARLQGLLVNERGWSGASSAWAVDMPMTAVQKETSAQGVWGAMALAFLGGLLLNVMPCVLPVLSLKALSFSRQDKPGGVRREAFLYCLGVVSSFLALGGGLVLLRSLGSEVGWGFQLQSPVVVAGLTALFLLMGLNFFGLFEVGTSWIRVAGLTAGHSGPWVSFLNGLLAVVAATPCTAPFMGTSLGATLTLPPLASLFIFLALGLGMAAPFFWLGLFPGAGRLFPKPGAWMETFKRFLGFPLIGTALWLLWVFAQQTSPDRWASLLAGLLFLSCAVWLWGEGQRTQGRWFRRSAVLLGLVAGGLFYSALRGGVSKISWETFSEGRVAQLREEGRSVFVDFTAAWCLTCQTNERWALSNPRVVAAFEDQRVAALKADWTSRDERITRALENLGRTGVPLAVLYRPGKDPKILPTILTPEIVLKELE